jgi:RNA polymerase sigma-70 factor (ECF subfamily)
VQIRESDIELVRRFQKGSIDAFELLLQRHQDRVYRLACAWLAQPDLAGDATQEVFLRAYKGLKRFRCRAEPFTWLYRTMKNVCHEFNRKRQPISDETESLSDPRSLEQLLETRQSVGQIKDALCGLSKRQREVLLLRVFEEFSIEDTAQAMKCRKGTVKSLQHSALKRLRELVNENSR